MKPEQPDDHLTPEQRQAIATREGDLLLDASAGSGKTSVLVERFARSVVEDGVEVGSILAITFTEKAAAELRDRIRAKLRSLGADAQARATEGAFISTIHGFCARVLRAQALAAGLDPGFVVLDEPDSRGLAVAAFDEALAEIAAQGPEGTELVASYRPDQLRAAIRGTYAELRSRGQREPRLPPFPPRADEQDFDYAYAARVYALLDQLLDRYGALYTQRKRAVSGLDFADLELVVRDLLVSEPAVRERYARRFERIMVDELQDVNAVQLELIEAIARKNLFAVGDALQSIYGFRHADVELFERLGETLERADRRKSLSTNFRSRPEIIEVINGAFEAEVGERFRRLRAGRPSAEDEGTAPEAVELLIVDKCKDWPAEPGAATAWRLAEARALAARIGALVEDSGAAAHEIVVLTRATTDLRCYERALEDRNIPTYVIGGRGYWGHPQVIDLLAYLRALANPRDQEALYSVLASPLVGASLDALVLLAAAARDNDREPWAVLDEGQELLCEAAGSDRDRLAAFAKWFPAERARASRASVEELIERVLRLTGYDLYVLGLRGGERRLANVRKLMRLGREHAVAYGPDVRGFLEFVQGRAFAGGGAEESEAPVEGEALGAVRLMTIHRAKGLEFPIVCVADLGRETPRGRSSDTIVVGRDGRVGLRLARPGTAKPVPILAHRELCDEYQAAEAAEERRLFYVAMTRARERLVLSGAARLEPDSSVVANERGAPIGWIARALAAAGVPPVIVRPTDAGAPSAATRVAPLPAPAPSAVFALEGEPPPGGQERLAVPALSYSSLTAFQRCGYRFYMERVLRIPALADEPRGADEAPSAGELTRLSAAERGVLAHALLEELDFAVPVRPSLEDLAATARRLGLSAPANEELSELLARFAESALVRRLAGAAWVRREQRFAFQLDGGPMITGILDAVAGEPGERMLVVDYKTDQLDGLAVEEIVASAYSTQRLVYALAALRAGAVEVEVAHAFLEVPHQPAVAVFTRAQMGRLERELGDLADSVERKEFVVSEHPNRAICHGCPAEGSLCPWPLELTRR